MCGASAWNPILRKDVNLIENVQKRFTMNLRGEQDDDGNDLSYAKRLQKLDTLSLERRRQYADMVFVYKALHGLVDCSVVGFGLEQQTSCTRGDGIKLHPGGKCDCAPHKNPALFGFFRMCHIFGIWRSAGAFFALYAMRAHFFNFFSIFFVK